MNPKLTISNKVHLSGFPEAILNQLKQQLTMNNPQHDDARKHGRYTGSIPKKLRFYHEHKNNLCFPRGYLREALKVCGQHDINPMVEDHSRVLKPIKLSFLGRLRPYQQEACRAVFGQNMGVLDAPTGSGKTTMAIALIVARKQPVLLIVHTIELLRQWVDRIQAFLGIEAAIIGDGKKQIGKSPVTIAMVQTLYKCASEVSSFVGHLIIDECHRTPSRTFTEAVTAFDAQYLLGLSATPYRRDKLSNLIFWHLGPMVHQVSKVSLMDAGYIHKPEIITRNTSFSTCIDASAHYSRMLSELCADTARNELIAKDVAKEAANGGAPCLVLTDRKSHCGELAGLLSKHGINAALLTGDVPQPERQRIVQRLNKGQVKVLIATGQLVGEGFDCQALSTLFLACPVKFRGRLLQFIGRIVRPADGKKAKVYDYVDSKVGVLKYSARTRQKVYQTA